MTKELKKSIDEMRKKIERQIETAILLEEAGLYTGRHVSSFLEKVIIRVSSLRDLVEKRRIVRGLFPECKFKISKWSPFGDKVIIEWWDEEHAFAFWLETTVEEDPMKTRRCQFVKESSSRFVLKCEAV